MSKKLEDLVSNLKTVISPPVTHRKTTPSLQVSEDSHEVQGMISKYEKLITLLKLAGQLDDIPSLTAQLKQLKTILRHLLKEEEEQKLLNRHYEQIRTAEDARDNKEINEHLRKARKDLGDFFERYAESFASLKQQLEDRGAELRQRLDTILVQLREINEQILDVRAQLAEAGEQIVNTEQQRNESIIALEKELDAEWEEHDLSIPKPDFQLIIREVSQDKNNPPRDSIDLNSRVMLRIHELIMQSKKRDSEVIAETLDQIDAEQARVALEKAQIEALEKRLRLRLQLSPNPSAVFAATVELIAIIKEKEKLEIKEQHLEKIEEALQKEALEVNKEIQEVQQDITNIIPKPENTVRPTPSPFPQH